MPTLFPTVDQPGFYTLRVTNLDSGCFDEVEILVEDGRISPAAVATVDGQLDCSTSSLVIDGSGSETGLDILYEWTTTNGNIVSGQFENSPTVDQTGTYTLTVLNTETGCSNTTSVEVTEDNSAVVAAIAPANPISCTNLSVSLDGSPSSDGPDITYAWTTTDGQLIGPTNQEMAEAGQTGTYTLTVTNTALNCTQTSSVTVTTDNMPPIADAGTAPVFNCGDSSLQLSGNASGGTNLSYQWTTTNGNILDGETTLTPNVGSTGIYLLTVTNQDNGCTATDVVVVTGNPDIPVAVAATTDAIDCQTSAVVLIGNGSTTGTDLAYEWSTTDGQLQGGVNGLSAIAIAAGTYQLLVTNTVSGCSSTATTQVEENTTPPNAEAGTAPIFSCGDNSLQLDGTGSGIGEHVVYNWTTADGTILSDNTTLMPNVGGPGTYTLTVRDTITACLSTDNVTVVGDINIPTVQITVNDTLDCVTNSLQLNATGSDSGANFNFNWTTTNGQFVSGEDSLEPTVNAGGSYVLSVTNTANNCDNSASVTVIVDTLAPVANIALVDTINCSRDTVNLLAQNSDLITFTYQWTTTDGRFAGATGDTLVQAIQGGSYQLRVSDRTNGCESMTSVNVVQDTLTPSLSIANADTLNCARISVDLQSSSQNTPPEALYQWTTTNGSFIGDIDRTQATVTTAGDYQLIVTNPINTCTDTANVAVAIDNQLPVVDAGVDQTLDCALPNTSIGGAGTASGAFITYAWSQLEGSILTDNTQSTFVTAEPGNYVLAVTNTNNACVQRDTVQVTANFTPPQVTIAPPNIITCTDTLASLDGSASTGQGILSYRWFTVDGSLFGPTELAMAEASQAGTYFLEVTDVANNCQDTLAVNVIQDDNFPQASIIPPSILDCVNPTLSLTGSIDGSGNLDFTWETTNGNFVSATDQLTPIINASGEYRLLVEDLDNNCRTQAQVTVQQDTLSPIANAGETEILNCTTPSLTLNGSATGPMGSLTYAWTGPALPVAATIPNPDIDQAGNYQLIVTNTANGCQDTSSVEITDDFLPPNLSLADPDTLNCTQNIVILDASASEQGANINFNWNGPEMNLPNTPQVIVNTPGTYTLILSNELNGCRDTSSLTVAVDRMLPNVQTVVTEVINCDQTSVSLQSNGSASGPQFSYTWRTLNGEISGSTTQPIATATAGGQYTLQITDLRNNCTDSSTVQVMVDTLSPRLSPLPITEIDCNQSTTSLALSVTQAGNQPVYNWSTVDGNIISATDQASIDVDVAGSYQVVVRNMDNGCEESLSFQVNDNLTLPVLSVPNPGLLTCTDLSQLLQVNSPEELLNYTWTATDGGQVIGAPDNAALLVTIPGTYIVEAVAADNGCVGTTSVSIVQDTLSPTISIAPASLLDCVQTQTQLDATASASGNNFSYNWSTADGQIDNGNTSLEPTVSQGGTYSLLITNTDNGCTATASIVVEQDEELPTVNIVTPTLLTCVVDSIILDATGTSPGLNYIWTSPNGRILSGADGLTPIIDQIGTYQLQVTNPANNCEANASIQVLANRILPQVDAGTDFELSCDQSSIQLDGSGSDQGANYRYLWMGLAGELLDNPTGLTPLITQTGTYQLLVTNTENGCTAADEVTVTQDLPIASVTVVQAACPGDQGLIAVDQVTGGTPPYLYAIDGETLRGNQLFPNLQAGSYSLLVEDAAGCTYMEELQLIEPDSFAIAFVENEIELVWGDSVQLELASTVLVDTTYQIRWEEDASLSCTDCLNPYANPKRTTSYRVQLVSPVGCVAEALVRILVKPDRPIYFPTAFSPNGDGQNDIFRPFTKAGVVTAIPYLRVYDRWGNTVFEKEDILPNDPQYGWNGNFREQPLNPAVFVYVAEVVFTDGTREVFSGDVALIR